MHMNGNTHAVDDRLSFWGIFGPGRYTMAFAIAAAVAALLAGMLAWQASMPIWGGTLIVAGVLAIPLALKWQDDLQRYGAAAVALSILLVLQAFHTLEHIVQVIQFYVLDRPGAQSFGLLSSLNAEWVHFTWNWLVFVLVIFLYARGLRNFWAKLLIAWAFFHGLEHTYMLVRYFQVLNELAQLGVAPLPVASALPGFFGRDGWLALSGICGRIPGFTTLPRVAIHFWWNAGEILLLALAAWRGLPRLIAAEAQRTQI